MCQCGNMLTGSGGRVAGWLVDWLDEWLKGWMID